MQVKIKAKTGGLDFAISYCERGGDMYQIGKRHFIIAALALSAVSYQNCSKVAVSDLGQVEAKSLSVSEPAAVPLVPPVLTHTEETLKTIQPALAVRGMACLMCHANIQANIITDFGLGSSDFLGGSAGLSEGASWFNNYVGAWEGAKNITGSVYVPNALITQQAQAALGANYQNKPLMTIAELMNTPYEIQNKYWVSGTEGYSEMALKITPDAGKDRVIAKSKIVIRAPSEKEIQNLAPSLWTASSTSGATRVNSTAALEIVKVGSGTATYSTNDSQTTLQCEKSDIVIRGTLLLRNLKVNASGGCRLYVSGAVFIEGAITYVGSGADQNLQITSASAIVMGIGKDQLYNRLVADHRGLQLQGRDYSTLANQVVQEAGIIGDLKDALNSDGTRTSIDFHSLLVNAPIIHSRYLGVMDGTIIAEAALFSLGAFHFTFDPVFTRVNVLPLLNTPVLSVQ